MGAINFIATIFIERAEKVSWTNLDIFFWTILTQSGLILFSFPLLGSVLIMLLMVLASLALVGIWLLEFALLIGRVGTVVVTVVTMGLLVVLVIYYHASDNIYGRRNGVSRTGDWLFENQTKIHSIKNLKMPLLILISLQWSTRYGEAGLNNVDRKSS